MLINFELSVRGERMRVRVLEAGIDRDVPHLAGYRWDSQKMVAVGQTAEEMRAADPAYFEQMGERLEMLPPFSPEGFALGLALLAVQLYVAQAVQALRPGGFGLVLSGLLDSINYELELPGYEAVAAADRIRFEKTLRDNSPRVRQLRINGRVYEK